MSMLSLLKFLEFDLVKFCVLNLDKTLILTKFYLLVVGRDEERGDLRGSVNYLFESLN